MKKLALLLMCCWLGLIWTYAQTQPERELTSAEKDKIIKVQYILRNYASLKKYSGTALLIHDEYTIYRYATGFASLDYSVPSSLTEQFNLCRLSEILTATAVLQLAQNGQIGLFDPVANYIPALKAAPELSIHHLLTHNTNLLDYQNSPEFVRRFIKIQKPADVLDIIASENPQAAAANYHYSASNYVLLGEIIAKSSGMTYKEYIEKNILKKIGAVHSGLYFWDEVVKNKATGYSRGERDKEHLSGISNFAEGHPFGATAIYMSVEDLVLLNNALHSHKLLNAEYTAKMMSNYAENTASEQQYGYGWLLKQVNGHKVTYQFGAAEGVSVQLTYYPEEDYTLIVCSNYYQNTATEIANDLERALLDPSFLVPSDPTAFFLAKAIERDGEAYVMENIDQVLTKMKLPLENVWTLNSLGRSYLSANNPQLALKVFRTNAIKFPLEDIVYDSLGDCYFRLKNYDMALDNFRRRLLMLPDDRRSTEMIKMIEETIIKESKQMPQNKHL